MLIMLYLLLFGVVDVIVDVADYETADVVMHYVVDMCV